MAMNRFVSMMGHTKRRLDDGTARAVIRSVAECKFGGSEMLLWYEGGDYRFLFGLGPYRSIRGPYHQFHIKVGVDNRLLQYIKH